MTRSQALEDELAAWVGDELLIAKVDNPAYDEGFDEPDMARRIGDVAHRAEHKHLPWREDADMNCISHLISELA